MPDPTIAVILVAEFTMKDAAAVPPNFTDVAPVRFVPVIVTEVPLGAEAGAKALRAGAGINVNPSVPVLPLDV